jgi:titin
MGAVLVAAVSATPAWAAAPDAPLTPTVTGGDGLIVVTYAAPANNGGSPIASYTATCTSTNGGATGTGTYTTPDGSASPVTVTTLTNGDTYTCTVTATNGDGQGTSPPSDSVIVGAPLQPEQPTVTVGDTQLVVTYVAPPNNGSQITGYTATCTSTNGGAPGTGTYTTPDGDTYTCTVIATNAAGPSPASLASAAAIPTPGAPNQPDQPTVVAANTQLVVTYVAPANNGSQITGYSATCTSTNGGTPGTGTYPTPDGSAAPITVTALTDGDTYTCTVIATNAAGPSPASLASAAAIPTPDAPNQPAQPTVADGNTQLVVTYAAPANNGSQITGYSATCTSTNGGTPGTGTFTTPDGSAAPITVALLTNGDTYTCTVIATNAVGASPASPGSAPVVVGVPNQPAQPTIVAANTQMVITYVAPANNGSQITSYSATCTSTNGGTPGTGTFTTPDGSAAPITVALLTNGATYTCTVIATNAVGASPASPGSATATPTAGQPAPPAQPTVARGNGQLVVAYLAPLNNGSPITSYSATCTSTNGGATGTGTFVTPDGSAAPITVALLTNGATYTCTVIATNAVGPSVASSASSPLVVGVPEQPAQPTVAAGDTQIVVTFVTPANVGSPIASYTATCTSTNGGVTGTAVLAGATAAPITVTSVTNADTYTCTVLATNAAGNGAASPSSLAVVPAAVPNAPAQPTTAAGNERITVSFVAPTDNGSTFTAFAATCLSSDGGTPGAETVTGPAATPIVVTSLTNGDTYTCTVAATNGAGTSPPSPASAPTVPAAAPAAPAISDVTVGSASLTVSFAPNSNNGSAITTFTATCSSANGGITGSMSGPNSPLTVSPLTDGNVYACTVTATNSIGASAASASSPAMVVGQPGPPALASVVSDPAPASSGSLKVSFHSGAANASAILVYRATCIPLGSGAVGSSTAAASPITVANLLSGHAYSCSVTATNFFGTSVASGPAAAIVGTPAPPNVLAVLQLAHGIALPLAPPADNGHPIIDYRARCTSIDGGAPSSPLQFASPIVANKLTVDKTYTCSVTAINVRGESPPTTVGPLVVTPPASGNLASCSGNSGIVRVSPGLLLAVAKPHTFTLAATLGSCSGPYVRAAQISVSFHTKRAISCRTAIGAPNGGSGTLSWTSPVGLGTSSASIQLVIDSTNGHTTDARFSGRITSQSNVFSNAQVTGVLVLKRGLAATTSGGDCSTATHLDGFSLTSATMTIS